ncbi:hypothetical protein L9F63_010007 [Diploptera punctata]|uniref:Solute carrier family 35 member F1 n=1 Tax=Diploptera punctata TaxID=6984 RepID=A0AAD8AIV3_DIPPU|nr:hypothetical protein L9F63_010007 [Diploptera punctata]
MAERAVEEGLFERADRYLSELGRWSIWRALMFGQLMSLLLCAMSVCNYYLSTCHQIALPTGQSTLRYVLQCLTFTTWLSCRSGDRGIINVLRCRGWRYMLLALIDVEANFLLILAHQFTTLTSIQLLDCVSIPAALALSCILLKVRYKIVHIIGVSVCLMGVGCLVWADVEDGRSLSGGKNQLLGDMLCLSGAIMFALVTVIQELVVKTLDWVEYLGMMGLLGSIYSILQTAALERHTVLSVPWSNWQVVALLIGFVLAQYTFQVLAPFMLRETGATALQLSLLTADFYWLMLNVALLQYKFHALYFLSFTLAATGVMIYAVKRTPISSQSQQSAPYSVFCVSFPSFEESRKEETTPLHTEMSEGSPDSQAFRMNGDALFY